MSSDDWDVDALKAVRVFFNPLDKRKPILKYLTSWFGFDDYWDEWIAGEDFGDQEQVNTFNKIIPADFERTKVGAIWEASKEWVDKQREMYFRENPQSIGNTHSPEILAELRRLEENEIEEAKLEGRAPYTLPPHVRQLRKDEAIYERYLNQRAQQKKNATLLPGESQKSEKFAVSLPNPAKATTSALSNASNANIPKGPPYTSSSARPQTNPTKRKKEETIILGLRYKTRPIAHLTGLDSKVASDRFRGRYRAGDSTPASRSTTSRRPRSKNINDLVIYPPVDTQSAPASPERSVTDSLFDDSDEETAESSDSIPLARQVFARDSKPRSQRNKALESTSPEDSDSDVHSYELLLSPKIQSRPTAKPPNDKAIPIPGSLARMSTSDGLARRALQPSTPQISIPPAPTNPAPNVISSFESMVSPLTPVPVKMNARKDVETLIPLGKNRESGPTQIPIPSQALQSNASAEEKPEEPPSPPLFIVDDEISTGTHMDVDVMDSMPDPVNFLRSVVEEISRPIEPEPKTNWSPVDLMLQSTNGDAPLCKVILEKVTTAGPPSLKWIHKNGFRIRTFRPQAQLNILLRAYTPWQHARLAAHEDHEASVIDALSSYMFENNMFALADTALDGAKLCFFSSQSASFVDRLNIPTRSELLQGPLRLLVTVIKPTVGPQPPIASLTPYARHEHHKAYRSPTSLLSAVERGLRLLRLPIEIRKELQQRYSNDLSKRTYVLCTVESFGFRHESSTSIETQPVSKHAAKRVVHQEETLALIHVMNELGYKGNQSNDSAATLFIHNAAFDMQMHLLGLHNRKKRLKVWFFAYGPFHALEPRLWGVREIFKRGGIVTFTAGSIMENVAQISKLLQCIDASTIWIAFVSPLVIGMLQAAAINDPDNQRALDGLFIVLEAVKAGKLSITTAPPHPWKVQDWSKWLAVNSAFSIPENFGADSDLVQDTILDSAEKALEEFANPPPLTQLQPMPGSDYAREPKDQAKRTPRLEGKRLEDAVDAHVFEDLRQMLFMPVLHTEYRRFIVLRATQAEVPTRDSIEHETFQSLVESDRAAFAKFTSTKAVSKPLPTPSSTTAMRGTYESPIVAL